MAEACYMARATMKQQVLNGINKLTLQTNKHGNTLTMSSGYFKKVFSKSSSANLIQATQAMAW